MSVPQSSQYPDFLTIGNAVRLVSVRSFAKEFDVAEGVVMRLLNKLRVPVLQIEADHPAKYINLVSLERVLYALLRPGGEGWRGRGEAADLSSLLEGYDSPLAREIEFVGRLYGDMNRKQLQSKARYMARHFRMAGDKLCKRRINELRELCLANGVPVGSTILERDKVGPTGVHANVAAGVATAGHLRRPTRVNVVGVPDATPQDLQDPPEEGE